MKARTQRHCLSGRRFPAEVLTEEEVQRLLRACSSKAPIAMAK